MDQLFTKHKKSLSNFIQDYLGSNLNIDLINKIEPLNPLQQSLNIDNKDDLIISSPKNKKFINQAYLTEIKHNKTKKKLFIPVFNNNCIKPNDSNQYQYISMINTNNTNNYSNIIINNNGTGHDSKKHKLKISN